MDESQRKKIEHTVFMGDELGPDGWPPEDALGFMAWFQERIDRIPVENRASAKVLLKLSPEYCGDYSLRIEIFYSTAETDEQMSARLESEARVAALRRQEIEHMERVQLAMLKHKYEKG